MVPSPFTEMLSNKLTSLLSILATQTTNWWAVIRIFCIQSILHRKNLATTIWHQTQDTVPDKVN